jgi:uncharacterized protein
MKRYLSKYIKSDLKDKMVFLWWPRQVGKTTLSKKIAKKDYNEYTYLNWDNISDKKDILRTIYKWWSEIIIFDEIHKYKNWKNFLKWEFDKNKEKYDFLVIWSARLDIYQKWWDSLLWRYYYFRLHPLSLAEVIWINNNFENNLDLNFSEKFFNKALDRLRDFWWFPEVFKKEDKRFLKRWIIDRKTRLIKEDIRDLSNVRDISSIELLWVLLPDRVASLFSINSLVEDLWVTHKTVSNWVNILENIYYIYRIYPYNSSLIKSIKKEPKLFLWDWSELKDKWAKNENLVASHLLKYTHFLRDIYWYDTRLSFVHDREWREVDLAVIVDDKLEILIEVKSKYKKIPNNLKYFTRKMSPKHSFLVVFDDEIDFEQDWIRVISASKFLTAFV